MHGNTGVRAKMTFGEFKEMTMVSMDEICRDIFRENRHSIKIKKEETVVRNLVNIFNATLKLSNEKGFRTMTLRDLCAETGLSMGALYSYISSKDELLDIIQSQGRRITEKVLMERINSADGPRERLSMAVHTHLYLSEVMQKWFFFSYMETKNLDRRVHGSAKEAELFTEKIFVDILIQGKEGGLFRQGDPVLTASMIKAMLQDWYLKRWKYKKRNISVEEYATNVVDMIESYILAE